MVAFAMTIARDAGLMMPPRMRIHSFAVWDSVVFLLNVLAFLLMGLQARTIVAEMAPDRLREAAGFAAVVILCLIAVRMAWVFIYLALARRFHSLLETATPPGLRQGVLVGWCGMRGLLTLATAIALPAAFPQRDLIVLTAFAVVLATLVVQGLTLAPLVRLLKLDGENGLEIELAEARAHLATAALAALEGQDGPAADHWRYRFEVARAATTTPADPTPLEAKRKLGLAAIRSQRYRLEELRTELRIGADSFVVLQQELDFEEVANISDAERHIQES
jgi:CPA1 family monovalent cation:H+ antiporter